MGGDDSQKLLPWRGTHSSPGRKPPAHCRINNITETALESRGRTIPGQPGRGLSYRRPGSFLESRGGSVLARAEARPIATVHLSNNCIRSAPGHPKHYRTGALGALRRIGRGAASALTNGTNAALSWFEWRFSKGPHCGLQETRRRNSGAVVPTAARRGGQYSRVPRG